MGIGSTQIIIFLIIVGFSLLSWVYRQMQEQKAKKTARDARLRREAEMLRTGRDPLAPDNPAQATAPQPARSLAERQAELRDQRRAAPPIPPAQSAPAPAQPRPAANVPPGMREVELWPGGPRVLIPVGNAQPTAQTGPGFPTTAAPKSSPPPRAQKPKRPNQRPPAAPASPPQPVYSGPAAFGSRESVRRQQAQMASRPDPEPGPTIPVGRGVPIPIPRTPAEWRNALIMNEVLSRPLSEREPAPPMM